MKLNYILYILNGVYKQSSLLIYYYCSNTFLLNLCKQFDKKAQTDPEVMWTDVSDVGYLAMMSEGKGK